MIGHIQVIVTSLVDGSLWCSLRFPGPADIKGKVDDKEIPIIEYTDSDWVSEFKVNKSVVPIMLSLSSESASEKLDVGLVFILVEETPCYETIPSCDVDITRSVDGMITTYYAVVENCLASVPEVFLSEFTRNGEIVAGAPSFHQKIERQDTLVGNAATVSFNSTELRKENLILSKLSFHLNRFECLPLSGLRLMYR